jgi:hypothetical protein
VIRRANGSRGSGENLRRTASLDTFTSEIRNDQTLAGAYLTLEHPLSHVQHEEGYVVRIEKQKLLLFSSPLSGMMELESTTFCMASRRIAAK